MNQKNSLGIDICFQDLNNPIELFRNWMEDAKKSEPNDPNALALATADKKGIPSVRMVLLKDFNEKGFVFYTNIESKKGISIIRNPNVSINFHWKSILKQVRIEGKSLQVSNKEADEYFDSRHELSKIGAWASDQSKTMIERKELLNRIFKRRFT